MMVMGLLGGTDFTNSSGENFRVMLHPLQAYALKVDLFLEEQDDIDGTPEFFLRFIVRVGLMGIRMRRRKCFVARTLCLSKLIRNEM